MPHETFAEDTGSHKYEQLEIIKIINAILITKRIARGNAPNDLHFPTR